MEEVLERAPLPYHGGTGSPIVLIHGAGGTWRQWRPVIPLLEPCHEVLAVNLIGHWGGAPQPVGADASIDSFADGVERDMDRLGWHTAHLAGISLGGLIALVLASRGRARSCTAISTIGGWDQNGDLGLRLIARSYRFFHWVTQRMASDPLRWSRRPRLRRLLFWHHFARTERMDPIETAHMIVGAANAAILPAFFDWAGDHDGPSGFDQIRCPVQLLFPSKDVIFPRRHYGQRLTAAVPHAEVHDLKGSGHAATWDAPDLVARHILQLTTRQETPVGSY